MGRVSSSSRLETKNVYEMLTTMETELVTADDVTALTESKGTGNGSFESPAPTTSDAVNCEPVTASDKPQSPFCYPTIPESENASHRLGPTFLYPLKSTPEVGLLSYTQGDHVLLVGSCCPPGRQGCPLGVNLATGATGMFSLCTGRRVPQYHTWVLHR
ncbi:unnamed protein product [Echinostoma caproni]|uniref:Uncharacterized protein n=1 Tax=Echinostoma caproni TaxID=27848 RepID=A0A183BBS0_9TREM|nr:unnamed protein product [Echinostoma caproni]